MFKGILSQIQWATGAALSLYVVTRWGTICWILDLMEKHQYNWSLYVLAHQISCSEVGTRGWQYIIASYKREVLSYKGRVGAAAWAASNDRGNL